jgi:hypothetical protein
LRTATAPPPHHDLSLTLSLSEKTTKQRTNNEETAKRPKGKDPILTFAPKPLKGLVNGNGNENGTNGARRTEHGTAHGDARTQKAHAASGQHAGSPKDGSKTDGNGFADGSPRQRERQPDGSG